MRVHIRRYEKHESFKLSRPTDGWESARCEVAIIGLGLIGGSIGLGLQDFDFQVGGFDLNPSVVEMALERGAVNGVLDAVEDACEADVIFICVPPQEVTGIITALEPNLRPDTIVTDCASVKAEIVRSVREGFPALVPNFVPGHPMSGKHVGGIANASWDLFERAAWVLCPSESTDRRAFGRINQLVNGLGAKVFLMTPEEHDRHVALLSHVPHVLAAQLMQTAQGLAYPQVAAGSWRDLTRVAGSSPELWTSIVMSNRTAIADALRNLADEMHGFATLIDDGDEENIQWLFSAAREAKRKLEHEAP